MTAFIDLERRFHKLTDQEVDDPENMAAWSEYLPGSTTGWSELLTYDRIVLLAEAGAGKTTEMRKQAQRLVEERQFAFFVPLDDLDREPLDDILSTDEETRFEEWKADADAPAWFFLDAVDELKLTHGKLDRALRRLSKTLESRLDRARIIVSCRPSDWRPLLDADTVRNRLPVPAKNARVTSQPSEEAFTQALRREYGRPNPQQDDAHPSVLRTFMMLPMSDKQIQCFAEQRGMPDVAAFLAAVRRHDAWTFARRPLDLVALMEAWTQSGALGTREQQHETNVSAKLQDDPERPDNDTLSETMARDGAECLALALALTRTRTIRSPEQALDADRTTGALDSDQILRDWSDAKRNALLRRALFDPATYGRVRFHHRSTQEYLAARRLLSLRQRGMSTKALLRLLFARCYGVEVVFPSMRAIAAWLALWDDAVCNKLMELEPETLLSLGDPASLDVVTRARILRQFVRAYGSGGWRGLNIPTTEVRRLAHPELASVIRECWHHATNDEVRELLIEMISWGAVANCADLTHSVAFDERSIPDHRVLAIRALVSCNRALDVAQVARNILERPASWPDDLVRGVAADLFPQFITAEQLLNLIERTDEPRHTVGGFEWVSQQIAHAIEPLSMPAVRLRNGLADLVRRGRLPQAGLHSLRSRFDYLVPALATLCGRQVAALRGRPDAALVSASVIAFRYGGDKAAAIRGGGPVPFDSLKMRIAAEAALRRDVFWSELVFVDTVSPTDDGRRRFHNVTHDGIVAVLTKDDRQWLLENLADAHRPERRPVALHALIDLWERNRRRASDLNDIRTNVKDDPQLRVVLDQQTAPPEPNKEVDELERTRERRKRANRASEGRRFARWKRWRRQVRADPAKAFSEQERDGTIWNIYSFLNALKGRQSCYDVWDRSALVAAFGSDVAHHTEETLGRLWRATRPPAWSARPAETRNQVPGNWVLGLVGVSAEAETRGWSARLSAEDVDTATAYAMIELNGFAPFLSDLVESHPEEVARVIAREVTAEVAMDGDHNHLPVLHDLTHATAALKRLCAPHLVGALGAWRSVVDSEGDGRRSRHLGQLLRSVDGANEPTVREMIAQECAGRYRDDPDAPLAVVWLKGLFRVDQVQGARTLVDWEHGGKCRDDRAMSKRVMDALAVVFGEDDPIDFRVGDPVQHAHLLGQLVRLAYAFVRPRDDEVHEEVFTPNTRDNAERARHSLFQQLCDTPGREAQRALLDIAEEDDFARMRDRIRLLARERAATDAELTACEPKAVVALGERYEVPPNDGSGLFAVMMDRLEDLAHDLAHGDFSDRRLLRDITHEREMQRTLGWRLRDRAKGAYRVIREEEVADAKEPDIRLATVGSRDRKVALEVKIADNGWSLADLKRALRKQLVGQYLRHENCTGGCLLLTYHGRKRYWVHPNSKTRLAFPDVVGLLDELARALEHGHENHIRVGVFGLDLSDRQPG